jgi:thiol:disulfide interchange protein
MRPVVFLLIVFVSVFAVVGVSKWRMPRELVPWQSDVAAAQAQAQKANKPILLYFTASWCGPCQMMRRNVWSDARVASAAAAYVPIRIDVDQNPEIAVQYGATESVPVLMVMDSNNQVIRRIDFALEADDMIAWLNGQRITAPFVR